MSAPVNSERQSDLHAMHVSVFNQQSFCQEQWEHGVNTGVYHSKEHQHGEQVYSRNSHSLYNIDPWNMQGCVYIPESEHVEDFPEYLKPLTLKEVCPSALDVIGLLTIEAVPFLHKHVHNVNIYLQALQASRGVSTSLPLDMPVDTWAPFHNMPNTPLVVSHAIAPSLGNVDEILRFIAPSVQIVSIQKYHATTQALDALHNPDYGSASALLKDCFPAFVAPNYNTTEEKRRIFLYDVCISDGVSTMKMVLHPVHNGLIHSGQLAPGTVIQVVQCGKIQDPADASASISVLYDLFIKETICPIIVRHVIADHEVYNIPYDTLNLPALPLQKEQAQTAHSLIEMTKSPYYTAITGINYDPGCVYRTKFRAEWRNGRFQAPHEGIYAFQYIGDSTTFDQGLLSCELLLPMYGADCVVNRQIGLHSAYDWPTSQRVHRQCMALRKKKMHVPTLRRFLDPSKCVQRHLKDLQIINTTDLFTVCPLSDVLNRGETNPIYIGRVVGISRLQSYAENRTGGYMLSNSAYTDSIANENVHTRPVISAGPEAVFSGASQGVHKEPYFLELFMKDKGSLAKVSVWGMQAVQLATQLQIGCVVALLNASIQTRKEVESQSAETGRKKYKEVLRELSLRDPSSRCLILPSDLASELAPMAAQTRQREYITVLQRIFHFANIGLKPHVVYLTPFDTLTSDTVHGSAVNVCGIVSWVGPLQLKKILEKGKSTYQLQRWFSITMPSNGDMYGHRPSVPVCLFSNNETPNLTMLQVGMPIVLDQVLLTEYYKTSTMRSFYLRGGHCSHLLLPLQIALIPAICDDELFLSTIQLVQALDIARAIDEQVQAFLVQQSTIYEMSSDVVHNDETSVLKRGDFVTHNLHLFHSNIVIPMPTKTQYSLQCTGSTQFELPQLETFQKITKSSLTQTNQTGLQHSMRQSRQYEVQYYGMMASFQALIPAVQGQLHWSAKTRGYLGNSSHISAIYAYEPLYAFTAYVLSDIQACQQTVDPNSLALHIISPHPDNLHSNAVLVAQPQQQQHTFPIRLSSAGCRDGQHELSHTLQSKLVARQKTTGSFSLNYDVKYLCICLADQFGRVDASFLSELALESIFKYGRDVKHAYMDQREERKVSMYNHTLSSIDQLSMMKASFILENTVEASARSPAYMELQNRNEAFTSKIPELASCASLFALRGIKVEDVIDTQEIQDAIPPYWRATHTLPIHLAIPMREFRYTCTPSSQYDTRVDELVSELAFSYGCLVELNRLLQHSTTYIHKLMVNTYKYKAQQSPIVLPPPQLHTFEESNEYNKAFQTSWKNLTTFKSVDLLDGVALSFESTYHSQEEVAQEFKERITNLQKKHPSLVVTEEHKDAHRGILSVPYDENDTMS